MRIIKPLVVAALMSMAGFLYAENPKAIHLCLNFTNGSSAYINVQDGTDPENPPTLNVTPTALTVNVPQKEAEAKSYTYEATGIEKFYFAEMEVSGIKEVADNSNIVITTLGGGLVRVTGAASEEVRVYDMEGRQVEVKQSTDGGTTLITLENLGTGVYIISCKNATLKITKK